MSDIKIIAHRGNNTLYPENTFPAFDEAIRNGVQAIETDIQTSKDGKAIICHNYSLRKDDNRKQVSSLNFNEISQINIASKEQPSPPPLLKDLIIHYAKRCELFLEIKWHKARNPAHKNSYAKTIIDTITTYLPKEHQDFYILSFDQEILALIHQLKPTWRIILNIEDKKYDYSQLDKNYYAINLNRPLINKADITSLKNAGFKTAVFTCDTQRSWKRMLKAGVDFIMTNCPHKINEWQS